MQYQGVNDVVYYCVLFTTSKRAHATCEKEEGHEPAACSLDAAEEEEFQIESRKKRHFSFFRLFLEIK